MRRFAGLTKSKFGRLFVYAWLTLGLLALVADTRALAQDAPDPSGTKTGKASMAQGPEGAAFTNDELKTMADHGDKPAANKDLLKTLDAVGQSTTAINLAWTLLTAFLVMFMQTGFAMVETGFCRAKNAAHVVMTNIMIYPIGILGFWACGFAIMFGSLGGIASMGNANVLNGPALSLFPGFTIAGTKGFFLNPGVYDVSVFALFLFQMVFMDTAATIPTGAMAERWRFSAFVVYGFVISMLIYPVFGHMVWGGGGWPRSARISGWETESWTSQAPGSSTPSADSWDSPGRSRSALASANTKRAANPWRIPGHHIPMAIFGTLILAFGWFGFNCGSTLGAAGGGNLRIAVIGVNTMLASAAGAFAAMVVVKSKFGKYDPSMVANGMLAGLVAITAPCAFVASWAAVLIGLIAGTVVVFSILFWERIGVDDPVGAVSVHGVCGILGLICVGIFADGTFGDGWNGVAGHTIKGVLYGNPGQLVAQLIGAVVCIVWAFGVGMLTFKVQAKFMRIRPTAEIETIGLDVPELGVDAYPDFETV